MMAVVLVGWLLCTGVVRHPSYLVCKGVQVEGMHMHVAVRRALLVLTDGALHDVM